MDMELQNRKHTTEIALAPSIEDVDETECTRDERDLIRLGKKPVLKASCIHIVNRSGDGPY